ncbi:tetratricopeptide repeat protein [Belliella marina]|uniref:Tetratricopeptide repeat protein n=1 Tax=Belliella marina TaxID=1644146 RepID=A0ABW4VQQ6_9BACT
MKQLLTFSLFICMFSGAMSQQNCYWFKHNGDMKRYEACIEAEKAGAYYQFSKEYHEVYDRVIEMDPTWAVPYRAKSVSYLKAGDFINWKKLMDKAVEYDTLSYLPYRAGCRFQFFRDYKGAIEDLLLLKKVTNNEMGYTPNGQYHLDIVLALCYKATGRSEEAIEVIFERFKDDSYEVGIFDYIHLGVLYLEKGEYNKAIEYLKKQEKFNDLAENRFYIAMAYKALQQKGSCLQNLKASKELYQNNLKMHDPYQEPMDKIYLSTIERGLSEN